MKKVILLAFAIICFNNLFATVTRYEWEKERAAYKLSAEERAMNELVLKQHQQYDYDLEDGEFVMYYTFHRIIYVNNQEAVQKHNRISISMHDGTELIELKARSISKSGKVIYFDKNDLKELKDEKTGNVYRVFAIEGIEIGSEIEYYFIKKMNGAIYERANMQSDVKVKQVSFQLTCPGHLKFDFKSYNGLENVVREETSDAKQPNKYHLEVKDVPAMKDETYSYYHPGLKKIEFKLAYNTARSTARLYTWEEAAKSFYKVLYNLDKDEEKALEKFVKSVKDNPSADLADRITNIEDKIKGEIKIDLDRNPKELALLTNVQKYKIASRDGMTRLFLGIFRKVGISCKPLIACSREKTKFDGKFDSWSYLDEYVIYFPDTKGYVAPYQFEERYPLVPYELAAQEALFIEPISIGDLKSALASIEEIPAADFSLNHDNHQLDVKFSDDLQSTSIKLQREFSGYNASFIAPYYNMVTEEQRKEMVEGLIKQSSPDAQIKTWDTKTVKVKGLNKFLVNADFQSSHFLEKAGTRILFKVGLVIGSQVEMYRDDSRTNPIENSYNRAYERVIHVSIPNGYSIKNAQDLKLNVLYKDGGEIPFSFESNYSINGNMLEIKVNEYYKRIYAPLDRYEDFRKVVNAAADFNKITLVLEKKN